MSRGGGERITTALRGAQLLQGTGVCGPPLPRFAESCGPAAPAPQQSQKPSSHKILIGLHKPWVVRKGCGAAFACKSDLFSASLTSFPAWHLRHLWGSSGSGQGAWVGSRLPRGPGSRRDQHLSSGTVVRVFPGCTLLLCSLGHLAPFCWTQRDEAAQLPAVVPAEAPSQGRHRPQQCFPARPWLHVTWKEARLRLARAPRP